MQAIASRGLDENGRMKSMSDVWHELVQYESRDLVDEAFQKRHAYQPNAARIRDITASFIQAREYFANASRAALTVRPLLQYYGVAALARGLVLLVGSKGAEALKPSHGLDAKDWQGTLAHGLAKIAYLEVAIGHGTFLELIEATGNKSYFKMNSSGINSQVSFPVPTVGARFSLADLVASMPDIASDYKVWRGHPLLSAQMDAFTRKDDHVELEFASQTKKGTIQELFQSLGSSLKISDTPPFVATIPATCTPYFSQLSFSAAFGPALAIGDVHVVPPIRRDIYLNTLALYFSAAFILGMIVRYFPSTWIALGRQERGDRIFPMINRLTELVQAHFPKIVLEFLRSPYGFEKSDGKSSAS
jgi:hypothetical protein